MKVRVIATLVMALCLAFGSANASSIGVFFAQDGSDCDNTNAPNSPITWYLSAVLGGDAGAGGITGAEFRMDGTPSGWFITPTRNPNANIDVGSPLTGGTNIAFPSCQAGANGIVLLFTCSGFATTNPSGYFSVLRHNNPSSPDFPCPLLVLCDAPVFTKICVPGGQGIINGGNCTVGVEQKSWSSVKSLYNN
jgi:hypothetical protein